MSSQINWNNNITLSKQEERICTKLKKNGKLFVFLRKNRHLIFTEEVHKKLLSMYSDYPRGKPVVCPSLLAIVSILQAYEQLSDHSAVLESVFDQRWQMVLGCLGAEESIFSQGTLCDFRHRLVRHDLDVMLLERTVSVAKEVGGFCHKQLRIALDSAPLEGAGRVEDTFNLIGHALELLVDCAAQIKQVTDSEIIKESGARIIGKNSIKASLDIDWSDAQEKNKAINILLEDVSAIRQWLNKQPSFVTENQYLKEALLLLETVLTHSPYARRH